MTDRDGRFSQDTPQVTTQEVVLTPQPVVQDISTASVSPASSRMQKFKKKIGKMHLFSAYCENPENVTFQTQAQDEYIILFMRKSQILNIPWILTTILFLFIPPLFNIIHNSFAQFLPSPQVIFVLVIFYYLLVTTYAFVNFITWYYNAALITNKRVIDVDFHQLVIKDVAETKLNLVQDVSYNQIGVIQNIFGFGHILIQTAGTLDNFEFFGLPQPERIEEVIENLIGKKKGSFYES